MGAKQYLSAALALGFAAVGVSANYAPDVTNILESQSQTGVVFDGANDEFEPEAVVNKVSELESLSLPSYQGYENVYITAEDNGYVIYSDGQKLDSYSFNDDSGELLTVSVKDGILTFTNSKGEEVTDFYIGYEHIIYDVNGDIHTSSGVLKVTTDAPKEQSLEELSALMNEDTEAFKALDKYITSGELDTDKYSSADELVERINELYLSLDKYSGFIESLDDEDVKDKLSAAITELESMTVTVNTQKPVYDENSGGSPELNMNKLIILTSVANNALESKGISPDDEESDDDTPAVTSSVTTKKTTTTTKKKTTTTTTKKTTKKKTTTTTTAPQAPVQTQAPAPATTTTARPVVTVATTTAPSFTVTSFNKTIYALNDGVFYEQPSTSSTVRGSFTKYYNAACTGLTSNGFYRVVLDGYTLYAAKSDFSEDPQSTVITTKAPEIKKGNINKYTKEMLTYINKLRADNGVAPLEGIEILDSAADIRAKELRTLFDHVRPDTTKYKTVFAQVGLDYHNIGENITYGMNKTYSVADAFDNWKNSQGHLSNMLNPDFKYMAIGYYSYTDKDGNDFNYWEQLFYTP
ncbi:MAG: CAP domain-containing protein [Ruminococcus sp.]|nr:CAP domain-containing protein [Ruminococcus sp.]